MEKIDHATPDLTQRNARKLAELFPNVATEVRDERGELAFAIDFDVLRDELAGMVVEGPRERYEFMWPGKREARRLASEPCAKTLRPEKQRSVDWEATQNLYIEGDNLDALKLLRETYAGTIKFIYLDPPYNTGHDFVYADDFSRSRKEYETASGEVDEEGGRLFQNLISSGRFHSDWCSMMYPRLILARDLLCEDGVLAVSIDDNEVDNLKKILDEVFGAENRLNTMVWVSNLKGRQISDAGAAVCHEYVLVYARDRERAPQFKGKVGALKALMPAIYKGFDYKLHEDERGSYIFTNELYNSNSKFNEETSPTLIFQIFWNPKTGEVRTADLGVSCPEGFIAIEPHRNSDGVHRYHAWRWSRRKVESDYFDLHFERRGDGEARVFTKRRNVDATRLKDLAMGISTSTGVADFTRHFGAAYFDYAKPVDLIATLVDAATGEGDIVMDFFSGSATTAEAVMKANARDHLARPFICVQLPEPTPEGSQAARDGYATICDIGEERIRRAGAAMKGSWPSLDAGFRVLRVDSANFELEASEEGEMRQGRLGEAADGLKADRTPEDLLFQALPAFRIPYSASIEETSIDGFTCFEVNGGQLIACFDLGITPKAIEAIARRKPQYAAFRGASLADGTTEARASELFAALSPHTICRVV